jgi:hypothetical protein
VHNLTALSKQVKNEIQFGERKALYEVLPSNLNVLTSNDVPKSQIISSAKVNVSLKLNASPLTLRLLV